MLFTLVGIIIGAVAVYWFLQPKLKSVKKLDEEIEQRNAIAKDTFYKLSNDIITSKSELSNLNAEKNALNSNIETLKSSINLVSKQADEAADAMYKKAYAAMQEQLSAAALAEREKYQKSISSYEDEYLSTMEELMSIYQEKLSHATVQLATVTAKLDDFSKKERAAIEANKREEEKRNNQNFYKLCLSDIDILEIKKLREVATYLRDSEPLNKVIYKVYYENPYTDLVGRVVGKQIKTGIYKITNLENQMCYVGQAADIASRWKQHIKRGVGAETPTRNKLYPAMMEYGVENFSFEIIEECPRELLNEREQYWQDYFGAKEFGYSIK